MDLITAMKAFARVAESGSFSIAAREIGSTQSNISKQVAALEIRLGARLLSRTTRSVTLTDHGRVYLRFCQRVLDTIAEAETELAAGQGPAGLVRLASPYAFARLHLAARLTEILRQHPALRVELIASDLPGDLVKQGIDVAIRFGALSGDMVVRRIGTTMRATVAAPEYLERFGTPKSPADLERHNCLVYTNPAAGNIWNFTGPRGQVKIHARGNLASNSSDLIREAVLAGMGVAVMPDWLFRDALAAGRLKRILRRYEPERLPIHLAYASRRFVPPKIRMLVDYLAAELSRVPELT